MQTIHHAALSPRRPANRPIRRLVVSTVKNEGYTGGFTPVAWPAIPRAQERRDDFRRTVLAAAVVCTGMFVAGIALWRAGDTRTVYVPIPYEPAAPVAAKVPVPIPRRGPISMDGVVGGNPTGTPAFVYTAPAMLLTRTQPVAVATPPPTVYATPPPVDYAQRDRQIEDLKGRIEVLDEQVRCVREHPTDSRYYWHYYSSVYHGVDQARRDAFLKDLDKERNDLRRQKWALEGR